MLLNPEIHVKSLDLLVSVSLECHSFLSGSLGFEVICLPPNPANGRQAIRAEYFEFCPSSICSVLNRTRFLPSFEGSRGAQLTRLGLMWLDSVALRATWQKTELPPSISVDLLFF